MRNNNRTQWINGHKILNLPIPRQHHGAHNHQHRTRYAENKRELESLEQARQFFEERGVFDFFCRGAPRHVDLKEVAEECLGDVQGDAAEEKGEEEEPLEIFEECS